jgi:ATP-dependent helicase/nuclease subunit A
VPQAQFQAQALDPARCVVVQACAGSGKTWLLSARIVRALLSGAAPDQILAITFTRKAADEMAARVNEWLVRLASGSVAETEAVLLELGLSADQAQARAQAARALIHYVLGYARPMLIDTFHGWFARLRGLAPLMESNDAFAKLAAIPAVVVDQAFETFFTRIGTNENLLGDYTALVRHVGWEGANAALRSTFIHHRAEWLTFTEKAQNPAAYASTVFSRAHESFDAIAQAHTLRQDLGRIANAIAPQTSYKKRYEKLVDVLEDPAPFTRAAIEQMREALEEAKTQQPFAFERGKEFLKAADVQFGSLAKFHDAVAHCHAQLQRCVQQLIDEDVIKLHEHFFRLGAALTDCYAQEKRARSLLDYTDLELDAARMLESREIGALIEAKLDAKIKHILVDEFQDTNPLQWRVLSSWLAGYTGAGNRPSVFLVGDPKQSIYRFRRADARIFKQAAATLRDGFDAVVLTTQRTRRNAQAVNVLVNHVFQDAPPPFAAQFTASDTPGSTMVLPLSTKDDGVPVITREAVRNPLQEARREVIDQRAQHEAEQIVAALRDLAAKRGRDWRWSEVMVLVNRWSSAAPVEQAFRQAGIAFVTGRNGGLLDAPEVQDVLALLQVLVSPQDSLALAQVLKSPLFGWDDAQLLELLPVAAPQGWWSALGASTQPHGVLAHQTIDRWRSLVAHLPIHDALDAIYSQADVIGKLSAAVPPERMRLAAANLERLLELALDTEGGRYPSLARFVDELRHYEALQDNDAPAQGLTDADDRVLITTVHGAKGLERDIVVLADANQKDATSKPQPLVDWQPLAQRPAHFSYMFLQALRTSAQRKVQAAAEPEEQLDENARLYVALTRAKRVLIVSGQDKRGSSAQSWYARVAAHVPVLQQGEAPVQMALGNQVVQRIEDFVHPQAAVELAQVGAEAESTRLGQCWHAWLERLAQHAGRQVQYEELHALALRFKLSAAQTRIALAKAQAVMASPACAAFFSATKAYCEVSVATAESKVVRMDRVAWLGPTIWVADYKLALSADYAQDYASQLHAYRGILQQLVPGHAVRAVLITASAQCFELNAQGDGFEPLAAIH